MSMVSFKNGHKSIQIREMESLIGQHHIVNQPNFSQEGCNEGDGPRPPIYWFQCFVIGNFYVVHSKTRLFEGFHGGGDKRCF